MNYRTINRGLAGIVLGLCVLTGCQTPSNQAQPPNVQQPTVKPPVNVEVKDFPTVTDETAVKIGIFARTHQDIMTGKLSLAYRVLYSTSWAQKKGFKLDEPFATLGYPIYRQRNDLSPLEATITDQAMNKFLNFMISQKLNELPTRAAPDTDRFKDDGYNPTVLYVETPQIKKIVYKEDVQREAEAKQRPELLTGFNTIMLYTVRLCNKAEVTYVTSFTDSTGTPKSPEPPKK